MGLWTHAITRTLQYLYLAVCVEWWYYRNSLQRYNLALPLFFSRSLHSSHICSCLAPFFLLSSFFCFHLLSSFGSRLSSVCFLISLFHSQFRLLVALVRKSRECIIVSRLYPTPLPRPISIQYSVTWRPTSSLSPCDTTIHLFALGPISVFVSRYTWYECAAGKEKQSQNFIEKRILEHAVLQLWLVRARVSTCQDPLRENEHC